MLILLPFLLLKPNRQARAWSVLVPFGVIVAIMIAGQWLPSTGLADGFAYMYPYIVMLASSLGILVLLTYAIPSGSSIARYLVVPALAVLPGVLILLFVQGVGQTESAILLTGYSLVSVVLPLTLFLAGRHCRKRWNLGRFTGSFLRWDFILVSVLSVLLVAGAILMAPPAGHQWWRVVLAFVVLEVFATSLLFALVFPFILTVFLSPLYRERLTAAFKVEPVPRPEPPMIEEVSGSPGDAG
ncbi:MAG: hypothetical protein LAP85_13680 [Acidobacteriia bacterium]|nr:hypothetical protein [Terriglobia bacterium]